MSGYWKLIKDEKPDYGMNVLIETTDGWMHEAFRNIGNRGDFYRSGKFTIDEKQIFAWRPLPADYHGSVPTNSEDVDLSAMEAIKEAKDREIEGLREFAEAVVQWSESYPVSVFGEPTPQQIDEVCKESGFRIDKISAMVLRRFTKSWGDKARDILSKSKGDR